MSDDELSDREKKYVAKVAAMKAEAAHAIRAGEMAQLARDHVELTLNIARRNGMPMAIIAGEMLVQAMAIITGLDVEAVRAQLTEHGIKFEALAAKLLNDPPGGSA